MTFLYHSFSSVSEGQYLWRSASQEGIWKSTPLYILVTEKPTCGSTPSVFLHMGERCFLLSGLYKAAFVGFAKMLLGQEIVLS